MRRFLTLVATLAVTGTLVAAPVPAYAAGTLSAPDAVLYDGCVEHLVAYSFELPVEASYWDLGVYVESPEDGTESGHVLGEGSSGSGSVNVWLCDTSGAGEYAVTGAVQYGWTDEETQEFRYGEESLGATTFQAVKRSTATSLRLSTTRPEFGGPVDVRIRSRRESPDGLVPNNGEYVRLEAKCGARRWLVLKDSTQVTNPKGVVLLKYNWNIRATCKLRGRTLGTDAAKQSVSPVVTVKVRS